MDTHKVLIIKQVLNYGAEDATVWLRFTQTPVEITEVIGAKTTKFYYKKGLGLVYRIDVSGTSFPGEYTLTSATLKQ